MDFKKYLKQFEIWIVVAGVRTGVFGQKEVIPARRGKLADTPFGRTIGLKFDSELPLAIDYYGHMKKSTGFFEMIAEVDTQVRMIECPVVHFASIKLDDIVELSSTLISDFPVFKREMLRLRGFKK
jgi:hypothetical protein